MKNCFKVWSQSTLFPIISGEEVDSAISSTAASTATSNAILSHGNSTDSSGVSTLSTLLIKGSHMFFSCINICRVQRKLFEHEANRPSSALTSPEGSGKC